MRGEDFDHEFVYWNKKYGYSYLFYTCITGKFPEWKQELSKYNVLERDQFRSSLLHIVCEENHIEICTYLLDFLKKNELLDELLNSTDCHGDTPLHIATYLEFNEICTLLLNYGALDTIKNCDDETVKEIMYPLKKFSEIN